MKRLVLIFAAFALIAAASCSKEQDELSTAYNSDVKAMMAVLENSGVDLKNVTVNEKMKCFIVEGDVVIDFSTIPDIKACLYKKSGDLKKAAPMFEVCVYGPLKAKNGVYCDYRASVLGESAVKYDWRAYDDKGKEFYRGVDKTFSVKMPEGVILIVIKLTATSSNGRIAESDDWQTINSTPATEH